MSVEESQSKSFQIWSFLILGSFICVSLFANLTNADSPNPVGQAIGQAVTSIGGLPSVPTGGDQCNEVIQVIHGSAVENDINRGFGTDFHPVNVSSTDCSTLVTFIPVVDDYDSLIIAAQQYNASNSTSVRNFYVQAFIFASDLAVVNEALYRGAFIATGEINDFLGLGSIRGLCGDACYSTALSSVHWALRDFGNQKINSLIVWVGNNINFSSPSLNLPSLNTNSITATIARVTESTSTTTAIASTSQSTSIKTTLIPTTITSSSSVPTTTIQMSTTVFTTVTTVSPTTTVEATQIQNLKDQYGCYPGIFQGVCDFFSFGWL